MLSVSPFRLSQVNLIKKPFLPPKNNYNSFLKPLMQDTVSFSATKENQLHKLIPDAFVMFLPWRQANTERNRLILPLNAQIDLSQKSEYTLGRGENADIHLDDPQGFINSCHLTLKKIGHTVLLHPLETRYGTTIERENNGILKKYPIKNDTILRAEDTIIAGTKFRYLLLDANTLLNLNLKAEETYPPISPQALAQSNEYAKNNLIERPLTDGFRDGGRDVKNWNNDGKPAKGFPAREVLFVDREKDPILKETINQFKSIYEQKKSAASVEEKLQLLWTFVNRVFENHGHEKSLKNLPKGYTIPLGEFIKSGIGVCRHEALLMKILADETIRQDEGITMVVRRGSYDGEAHTWTECRKGDMYFVLDATRSKPEPDKYTDVEGKKVY